MKEILTYLGVSGPLVAGIWASFNVLDRRLKPQSRRILARLIVGFPLKVEENWRNVLLSTFDSIFGTRTISVRNYTVVIPKYLRTCALSVVIVVVLLTVFVVRSRDSLGVWSQPFLESDDFFQDIVISFLIIFLLFVFLFNTIVDYFSLFESRLLLFFMSRHGNRTNRRIIPLGTFAMCDIAATTLIFLASWYVAGLAASQLSQFTWEVEGSASLGERGGDAMTGFNTDIEGRQAWLDEFGGLLEIKESRSGNRYSFRMETRLEKITGPIGAYSVLTEYIGASGFAGVFGIFVISTYATSIWTILFVVASISVRILGAVDSLLQFGSKHLFLKATLVRHPLKYAGSMLIAMVIVTTLIWRLAT